MSKALEYVKEELSLTEEHLTTYDRMMLKQVEKELENSIKTKALDDIEKDSGCSIEVVFKALKNGIYCEYCRSLFSRCKLRKLEVCLVYDYGFYLLRPTHKADFSLPLDEYKKTWWLKEDKSE